MRESEETKIELRAHEKVYESRLPAVVKQYQSKLAKAETPKYGETIKLCHEKY